MQRYIWWQAPEFTTVRVVDDPDAPTFSVTRCNNDALQNQAHPDYLGREILFTHIDPTLASQEAAEVLCARLYAAGAHARRYEEVR
jgi:hypothetical protein